MSGQPSQSHPLAGDDSKNQKERVRRQASAETISESGSEQTMDTGKAFDLKQELSGIISQSVTYKGVSGFFVPKERLEELQNKVDKAIQASKITDGANSTLLNLQKQLVDTRSNLATAELELKSLKSKTDNESKSVKDLRNELKSLEAINRERLKASEEQVTLHKKEINALKERLEIAKRPISSYEKPTPAQQEEQQKVISELKSELSLAHANLNALKAENKSFKADEDKLREQVAKAEAQVALQTRQLQRMQKQSFKDVAVMPVHARQIALNESTLLKWLGKAGVEWLQRADVEAREHVRDKAFKLLKAVDKTSNKQLKGIKELLLVVYNFCKGKLDSALVKLANWLNIIIEDIVNLQVKTVAHYRQCLEETYAEVKLQLASNSRTWSEEPKREKAKHTSLGIFKFIRKFVFGTKKEPTFVSRVWNKVAGFFRVTKSAIKKHFEHKDDPLIFDVDELVKTK